MCPIVQQGTQVMLQLQSVYHVLPAVINVTLMVVFVLYADKDGSRHQMISACHQRVESASLVCTQEREHAWHATRAARHVLDQRTGTVAHVTPITDST